MKYWAQFYHQYKRQDGSTFYEEGCGDRQLIFLDGRWSLQRMTDVAADECAKRGYQGFRLVCGNSILRPFYMNATIREV
jgi:type VI protein secretion system component VasK